MKKLKISADNLTSLLMQRLKDDCDSDGYGLEKNAEHILGLEYVGCLIAYDPDDDSCTVHQAQVDNDIDTVFNEDEIKRYGIETITDDSGPIMEGDF